MKHSWDDLRLVLAITDGKGLSGAARRLGVHHATILRRLDIFESQMGVVLFDRQPTGYVPTQVGEALAERAREISRNVEEIYLGLAGEDLRLSGSIRITTTDFLAQTLFPEILKLFREEHPSISIELIVSSAFTSLSKRDADVALRTSTAKSISKPLSGQIVHKMPYGIYAHRDIIWENTSPESLLWVGNDDTISHSTLSLWQEKSYGDVEIPIKTNNMMSKFQAIKNGLGAGYLPRYMGDREPSLFRLEDNAEWSLNIWFVAHTDLYKLRRIKSLQSVVTRILKRFK